MIWHDLTNPDDPQLDALAEQYHIHPLHIEDCRHRDQRAKVEEGADYLFVVAKTVHANESGDLEFSELDIFLGKDYIITVEEGDCPSVRTQLQALHATGKNIPDHIFYKILDGIVDSYVPVLDWFNETIDEIEDLVLDKPSPATLQRILELKRGLIELRRILANMRDVANQLQRFETPLIRRELWPYLRDIYDHVVRDLEMVEMHRDLLAGTMDIYLSSVANRTNQVMKVLTVLGTIALPAVVISGFYGMNTKDLPWAETSHGTEIAAGLMLLTTAGLLLLLKKFDWF
ncbi:MAG: magnesium/cobalt transporter CorA [Bryobacteraceae bacterium]